MTNLAACTETDCPTLVPDTPENRCGRPTGEGYTGDLSDEGCGELFCDEHLWATYADGYLCSADYNRVGDRVAAGDAGS